MIGRVLTAGSFLALVLLVAVASASAAEPVPTPESGPVLAAPTPESGPVLPAAKGSDDRQPALGDGLSPAPTGKKGKKAKERRVTKENPGIIDIRFFIAGDLAFGGGRVFELLSPRSGVMPTVRLGRSWRFELGIEAALGSTPITFQLGRRAEEPVTVLTPGFRGYGLVPFAPKFFYSAFRFPIVITPGAPVQVGVAIGIGVLYQFDDTFSFFLEAVPGLDLPVGNQPARFILASSVGFAIALF